jgi:hypothetical protein
MCLAISRLELFIIAIAMIAIANCSASTHVHCDGSVCCDGLECSDADSYDTDPSNPDADSDGDRQYSNVDILFVVPSDSTNWHFVERMAHQGGSALFMELLNPTYDPVNGSVARPTTSLHIGSVTTDMGAGGFELASCSDGAFGDDGALQMASTGHSATSNVECSDFAATDCADASCPWLLFDQETTREAMDAGCICITDLGPHGCGWEQHFEAARAALTRNAEPSGTNWEFFRSDAILAVIFLADGDECSVSDPSMFDLRENPDESPDFRCVFRTEGLFSVSEYFATFEQIAEDSQKTVVVAGIIGIPNDGSWLSGDPINELYEMQQFDPETPDSVLSLDCSVWYTAPSPRIAELITMFGDDGYMASICEEDWSEAFMGIARTIQRHLQ